jgi:hypothetical protein
MSNETNELSNQSVSESSNVSQSTAAPTPTSAPAPASYQAPTPAPRTYTDDEVNHIVGGKKKSAYEKGYAEAKAELEKSYQAPQATYSAPQQQTQSAPSGYLTEEQVRKLAADEFQKNLQNHTQKQFYETKANDFVNKMNAGKSKFSDFETVVASLNIPQIPEVWMTAGELKNPELVMYELGKDPQRFANIMNLKNHPEMLKRSLEQIEEAASKNLAAEEAKKNVAPAPLARQKPPTVGIDSGRDKSTWKSSDFRKLTRV